MKAAEAIFPAFRRELVIFLHGLVSASPCHAEILSYAARSPLSMQEVPTTAVAYIARQVGVPAEEFSRYDWEGRTVEHHAHRSVPSSAFASRRCKMPRSWPSGYLSTCCRKAIRMNTCQCGGLSTLT